MDYSIRISNSNLIMGNIREMNQSVLQKESEDRSVLIDFLFEPKNNFDSFKKNIEN